MAEEETVAMPLWKWQISKKLMESFCSFTYESLMCTARYLMARVPFTPRIGIICGSGLGAYIR